VRTLSRRGRLWVVLIVVATVAVIAVPSAPAQDRDCGSFSTQASAQAYFIALGGPTADPDRLDGDSDGVACESLPCPCSAGAGYVPTPVPSPVPTPVPTTTPTPIPSPGATPAPPGSRRSATILRVIDGDALRVRLASGRQITVRLIGIDTPETKRPGVAVECGGRRATAYMKQLALRRGRGRSVTLASDPSQRATDRYGRTLAYVDAAGKGDLGQLMLRSGWAAMYVFEQPFARTVRYQSAASHAERRIVGTWDWCDGDFHRPA
jgi:endonuclease YncB( thermonuclease family)